MCNKIPYNYLTSINKLINYIIIIVLAFSKQYEKRLKMLHSVIALMH